VKLVDNFVLTNFNLSNKNDHKGFQFMNYRYQSFVPTTINNFQVNNVDIGEMKVLSLDQNHEPQFLTNIRVRNLNCASFVTERQSGFTLSLDDA
jgi:hypothetical protein